MVLNIRILLAVTLCSIGLVSSGQIVHPANTQAFLQSELAEVHIIIDPDSLQYLFLPDSLESNHEYPATFKYITSTGVDSVANVGFRLRGNTSRYSAKKSFKISFNTFNTGSRWNDLKKMNLNGEHNDPSILRSWLSNTLLSENQIIAIRNSYVKLFINGEYKGLYFNAEHIDKPFITQRFGSDNDGNLYKSAWGANLAYLGTNPSSYVDKYELNTNTDSFDYSGLIHFIDVLNNTPSAQFACAIQQVFDVESYLKTLAMEVLIGHWDGYSYNQNNYYLYENPADGRFVFIEYDMDNTFGIDWFNVDWANRNIYTWANSGGARPLFTKLMAVPYFKDLYSSYIQSFINGNFQDNFILLALQAKQAYIQNAAFTDTYKGMDYGFSNADFTNALTQAWGAHVTTSIFSYVIDRKNSAHAQLVFSGAPNPCTVGIEELTLGEFIPSYATDMMGKIIPLDSKNCLKIVVGTNGQIRKTIDIE
ncbi:MAG: CotH kinase family protein [Crocinitomicaceae bacterium]